MMMMMMMMMMIMVMVIDKGINQPTYKRKTNDKHNVQPPLPWLSLTPFCPSPPLIAQKKTKKNSAKNMSP